MSGNRWLNGTTSRNANSTCTPGRATLSSCRSSPRLRSSRSFSDSLRPPRWSSPEASMPEEKARPPDEPAGGPMPYLDRDLDEAPDRLPPELLRPPASPSVEPAFDRLPPLPFASVRPAFERDEPELDRFEPEPDREELDRLPPLDFAPIEPE